MAKKRERRAASRADNQAELTQRASAEKSSGSRVETDRKSIPTATATTVLFLVVLPAISVIIYRTLYGSDTNTSSEVPYVHRRGLVDADINYRQVLDENMKTSENSSLRNFKNPVLAYITPWNSQGYDMAKKFSNKFTHLSPVWYELKSQGTKLVLEGRHNADKGWIMEIRRTGNAQILPRVVLEAIPVDLLKKKKQMNKAVNLIIAECKEMEYDGIVLESWSRWAAYGVLHDPDMRRTALQFIRQLGQAIHSVSLEQNRSQHLQLVYVIGPPRSETLEEYDFGPEDLQSLSDDIDGFSLMTYDFSGPQNPGPNAPLSGSTPPCYFSLMASLAIIRKCPKRFSLVSTFTGMILLFLEHRPQLQWEKNSAEHFFLYSDDQNVKHVVFYPSPLSIAMRLQEAHSWGAGISIWEIGQGLEYFFDIL
ncbi:UNVERIFIED_CONTAM: Chitinase domain-containing protein 1 [Sesamum calycinum]|uniref:Chitinase domain-containing protein 1 n=1 Tax=Sesamum calycinum TaxID=2727403 RepID=A0AAW2J8U0_9LAMI